jgi:hypothetical protein
MLACSAQSSRRSFSRTRGSIGAGTASLWVWRTHEGKLPPIREPEIQPPTRLVGSVAIFFVVGTHSAPHLPNQPPIDFTNRLGEKVSAFSLLIVYKRLDKFYPEK